ncbi:uncharacterized protein [Arachis hypogaea]|uniref:uncharacterized protein n=1 Tax=Arachis hypogaea TaxID=3818 RepID=UPI000DECE10E|nr:uncharacterized protein LOC112803635 [Arachis hypogaea]
MTRSLPDPSLATFDPKIERALTCIRQARRRLAFVHSESGSLEDHSHSLSPPIRDHHSPINEETLYLSMGSTELSLSDSGDIDMADPPRRITLKEDGAPDLALQPLHILYPALDPNFELKSGTINLLPKYSGMPGEDPLKHLKDFQVACATARRHGADEAAVLVFAFPFFLEGKSKEWFYTQPGKVRSNWDLLRKEFLEKFDPPQKKDKLRREISCIVQRDGETLYGYWERFKKLLETCPHHRIDELVLISYFCQGMHHQDKLLLDVANGGSLTKTKTTVEAWEVISDLSDLTQHSRARSSPPKAVSGVSPSGDAILTKTLGEITILLRQITQGQQIPQTLINTPPQPPRTEGPSRICGVCTCTSYYTDEYPQIQEDTTLAVVNPYLQKSNYNQGSYPQGASTSSSLPSQPQPNPKGSINIITLRSGTKLDKNVAIPSRLNEETNNEEVGDKVEMMRSEDENVDKNEEEPPKVKEPKRKTLLEEPLPIPFSTLAKKAKKQEDLDPTVVEVFEKVKVTVPLFQAIQQVPKYAKFPKDICSHKDKLRNINKKPEDDSISSLLPKNAMIPVHVWLLV